MASKSLKVTEVWQWNYEAINRKMFFVSLENEADEHYKCKVYRYDPSDESFNYIQDYEFEKSAFDYEHKLIHHSSEISGYITYDSKSSDEIPQIYIKESEKVLVNAYQNRYRYINNTGSSRSSKTWSIIDIVDWYCRGNHNKRVTAWRDTKKSCKDTVLKDFNKRLKTTGRFERPRFNKSESYYRYGSDEDTETTFEIHGGDDEDTVHGLTQDIAWLNEPYKISEETFDQIDQRTSEFVIFDLNPKISHWSEKVSKHWQCKTINSTFKDNPYCPPKQKQKILSYQPVSLCQIVVDGKLNTNDAFAYDTEANRLLFTKEEINELQRCKENEQSGTANQYLWEVYGLGRKSEKPNKIYTGWKRIPLAEYLSLPYDIYYGLDFGLSNPTAVVEIKYNDGVFYFHELLYTPEKEMKEGLISELLKIGIDKTAPLICDSANPDKIKELRVAGFNARPAKKGPGSVLARISMVQRANVCFTNTSENLDIEYEAYEWDSDRLGVLDKPLKFLDHLLDAAGYGCHYIARRLKLTF